MFDSSCPNNRYTTQHILSISRVQTIDKLLSTTINSICPYKIRNFTFTSERNK
ncbi:hypothetical protein DPMN_187856 [Dreissena polymorpha]|uniref:Uncharacterized protein n=1 Tax=Dreissena polymorpha TaxID=45954 RepID=A0A9D4IAT9_DREPO|nr:hypothetical protein DPMN_187856 [Dreissena polymorpha]